MRTRVRRLLLLVFAVTGICCPVSAQVFKFEGGTSTLFNANGGSVEFKAENYEGQVGLGFLDGHLRYGGIVRTKLRNNNTLSAGDDTIAFDLPTDVFGGSHYFLARGIALQHTSAAEKAYALVGTTSQGFSTPFFTAAGRGELMSAVFFDRKIGDRLRFVSRSVISSKRTSIEAVEWAPRTWLKASLAAGFGSDEPYGAASVIMQRRTMDLRASFIESGKQFERIRVLAPITSELERQNISFAYRPMRRLNLSATHQNVVQPAYKNQPTMRATVDEVFASDMVAQFNVGGGLFSSRMGQQSTLGTNVFAARNLTQRLNVTGNLFQSRTSIASNQSTTLTATVRFVVNQKITVSQITTRSAGRTTAGFGGDLVTNFITAHVGYETVYAPLRLDSPFQQALSVNAAMHLPGNFELTVASFVSPTGELKRSVGIGRYLYRMQGMGGAPPAATFRFPKFVVQGKVVDASGAPVEGAAIHIGDQVAYTDAQGIFMVRVDKRGPHALTVAVDEFTAPGNYRTISAPSTVMGEAEESATPIRIAVERVKPNAAETRQ